MSSILELKNKQVLVTGADGFIGSHLTEELLNQGCLVKAFVCYNSFNRWGWLDSFSKDQLNKIEAISGDIRDSNHIREAMKGVDVVFHLAALVGIPFSYHAPKTYVDTNVQGSLNILQAAKEGGCKRVIMTSTSEVYGTARSVPINENHPLQAQSPYSATKIAADALAKSFYFSYDLPIVIARPFNTYGPRQSARAIIPTIIVQLLQKSEEIKLGDLRPTRDFNFVQDVCKAFVALAECNEAIGKEVNIGSGVEISMEELANQLIQMIHPSASIVSEESRKRPENSEVHRLLCDNSLIQELTTWKPTFSLEEGLTKTLHWYRDKNNLAFYKESLYNT